MLKIGPLTLPSRLLLAPLAGISDSAFRLICRAHGCRFTFIEMINARAISFESRKTKKMLTASPQDRPLGVQLVGTEIPYLLRAVDIFQAYDFDLLDFNCACPVRKVCRRGEGAALMKDPQKLRSILKALRQEWPKGLTIKIRSGWDASSKNALEIARLAQECGFDAVFIHGRDRQQFYKGTVDYRVIAEVKKHLDVPVIASGDIWSAPHAKKMFEETGCDGITVARGALGHPWIFEEIEEYLKNGCLRPAPSTQEILDTLLRHLELSVAEHGEKSAVALMRKFAGWYFRGHAHVRPLRQKINTVRTQFEFCDAIRSIVSLPQNQKI